MLQYKKITDYYYLVDYFSGKTYLTGGLLNVKNKNSLLNLKGIISI